MSSWPARGSVASARPCGCATAGPVRRGQGERRRPPPSQGAAGHRPRAAAGRPAPRDLAAPGAGMRGAGGCPHRPDRAPRHHPGVAADRRAGPGRPPAGQSARQGAADVGSGHGASAAGPAGGGAGHRRPAPDQLVTSGSAALEAAFAMLAGVAPIPASSGQVVRYRFNQAGIGSSTGRCTPSS